MEQRVNIQVLLQIRENGDGDAWNVGASVRDGSREQKMCFCFPAWRASWKAHVLQTWRQSKNVWQRFCDRFLHRPLLTVSRSFMNVAKSVLWRMAIILKANKVNLFVSSVWFVFWYHSLNSLDTPHTLSQTYNTITIKQYSKADV